MNGDLRAILPVYMAFLSKQKVGKDSRNSCVTEKKSGARFDSYFM